MEYTIRKASPNDARGVAMSQKEGWIFAHVNKDFNITEEDIVKHLGSDKDLEKQFRKYLERTGTPYYVVEVHDEIMGYAGCYKDDRYWTGAVYLKPPVIGYGIGGELFNSILNDLPKGDKFLVKIATFNKRSQRMFEKIGFIELKEQDEFHLKNSDRVIPLIKMVKTI
jgi:N-acetylglutamate synthase-like GNAT family acetyltransferase